jgi:outer membrane protein
LKRAKQEIALDMAQTFLQVILDQDLVKIAQKNLASSRVRENLLREQTRVGVRNLADFYRQEAQTSSDEAYLVTQQSKQRSDELMLLRKLRMDASQNYRVVAPTLKEDGYSAAFDDEDELVQTALANRADLTASERTARAFTWDVTASRASYFPRLDLGASILGAGRILDKQLVDGVGDVKPREQMGLNDQLTHQVYYTVGLTLTWNIFDRWITQNGVERAKVNARNAQLDSEDRRNQVIGETRQAFGDYRAVLQQLESTKKGLLAAQKAYEVMKGRYQVGSASFVDLTTAQAALVQAEASRAQAVIAFALQTRELETALGTVKVE